MAGLSEFVRELRRRNVFRVAAAYAVVVWLVVQIASIVLPTFGAPNWTMQVLLVVSAIGFPIVILVAWTFELTAEGLVRDEDVVRAESIPERSGRKLDFVIIAVLAAAVVFFALDKFVWIGPTAIQKSVAVLPFENLSGDHTTDPFTVGVHDDLLTHLSKISSIKTISRTSVLQYRGTTKPISEIADELGVATILEGGVQKSGDRVRINAQLIDARTDAHLWADTYDRQLTAANIFAIQTEIASAIADALRATLSPNERRNITTVPTEHLAAFEAYQLGKQALARRTVQSVGNAIEYFSNATEIDPDFAQPWAGLADAYRLMAYMTAEDVDELHKKAFAAVDRALDLDDQVSETHTALAALFEIEGRFPEALQAIKVALQLNPNDADAIFRYAGILHDTGHTEQSLLEWEKAVQLDPLSPVLNDAYAWTLAEVGHFDESLARYQILDEIDPRYPGAAVSIGTIYGLAYGRLDLTNLWYRKALALDPENVWTPAGLGLVFLELGDDDQAEFWINKALEMSQVHPWANGAMMMLNSYREDSGQVTHYANLVNNVDSRWRQGTALAHGRVPDLRAGNYDKILQRYKKGFPEVFVDDPEINSISYRAAIDVAGVLLLNGNKSRAEALLQKCLAQISEMIRVGFHGFWVSDVQILALQGKSTAALKALRQAIDQSWRTDWRFFFYVDPNLDSIRDKPEFQAMREEIKADMAAQLERAREMEANGELAAIPN